MTDIPGITLNDGRVMPQFGLGVFQTPVEETEQVVSQALDLGYTAVDTAMIYGNEEGVGRAVRQVERPVFVTTKLWIPDMGPDATAPFNASMERLGIDWLDLYLIHWPVPRQEHTVHAWQALVRLQREDERLRSIGVSNYRVKDLQAIMDATGVVPAVNQIELHPPCQPRELRAFHAEHGIATTSWSPLGRGGLEDPVLADIAAAHGKTPAQVVIRWHIQSGLIVIPPSVKRERLAENMAVFDWALDEEDMARIDGLDSPDGRTGPDPATFTG